MPVAAKKINSELKTLIIRAIAETLSDPDFGLRLSDRAKQRLRSAQKSHAKTISLSEVKRRHGL